jgi:DNA-binding NarL/FixJ family response regulator
MPKSVLIVDDSRVVRQALCQFFETSQEWKVVGEAADGAEGIQTAIELKPDLILLDVSMPKMNGVETASVIKKLLPDVYIIAFTLFDGTLGPRLSSAVGVDLVVPKAEGLTGLVNAIRQLIGTQGIAREQSRPDQSKPSITNQT